MSTYIIELLNVASNNLMLKKKTLARHRVWQDKSQLEL